MNSRIILLLTLACISARSFSQWEVSVGAGPSFPMTGYGEVVETGVVIFNLEGKYRFKSGLAVGARTQYARFSKDKDPDDDYHGAKISVAPVIFNAEYELNKKGNLRPYVAGGIGISFFSVSYNSSATSIDDKQINNVSFTMMPLIGLRYRVNDHLFPHLETGWMLIADGPPPGFPQSDKLTGYNFVALGVAYRF